MYLAGTIHKNYDVSAYMYEFRRKIIYYVLMQ